MEMTIHQSFLPHRDPDQSVAFYTDVLGFEVRLDVGSGEMRFITLGPPNQPDTAIVLQPPTPDPSINDAERNMILAMMDKGTYAGVNLATPDLDAAFERIEAAGADIVQEPIDQDYGLRDCAVRDPAGNLLRIQERPRHGTGSHP